MASLKDVQRFVGDVLTLGGASKERGAKRREKATEEAAERQLESLEEGRVRTGKAAAGSRRAIERGFREGLEEQMRGFEESAGVSKETTRDILRQIRTEKGIDRTSAAFKDLQRKIGKGADQFISTVRQGQAEAKRAIQGGARDATALVEQGRQLGLGALEAGATAGRGRLQTGAQRGIGALQEAEAAGRLERQQGLQRGLAQLDPALQQQQLAGQAAQLVGTRDIVGQQPGLAGQTLAQAQARGFEGFEQDPGFQFALRQQEEAINRAAAARGGRLSGRTLRELQESSAGLASQQFDRFAQRRLAERQQELGAAGGIDARSLAALQQQAGLEQQAGLAQRQAQLGLAGQGFLAGRQAAGLEGQTAESIARARAAAGAGQAGIHTATGTQLAALERELGRGQAGLQERAGTQLANIRLGTGQQLAGLAERTAGQVGSAQQQALTQQGRVGLQQGMFDEQRARQFLGMETGATAAGGQQLIDLIQGRTTNLTNLQTGRGTSVADVLMREAGINMGITQQGLSALAAPAQAAGMTDVARGQTIGGLSQTAATVIGGIFGGPAGAQGAGGAAGAVTGANTSDVGAPVNTGVGGNFQLQMPQLGGVPVNQ